MLAVHKPITIGRFFVNKLKNFPKVMKEKIDNLPEEYKVMTLGRTASYMSIRVSNTIYSCRTTKEDIVTIVKLAYDTENEITVIDLNKYDNYYGHNKYGTLGLEATFYDKDFNPIPMYDTIEILIPMYPSVEKYLNNQSIIPLELIEDSAWFDIDNDNLVKGSVAAYNPYQTAFFGYETFVFYEHKDYIDYVASTINSAIKATINKRKTVFPRMYRQTFIVDLT